MKKLLFSLCLLLTIGVFAQEAQAQRTGGFGIRGGLNLANLNDTDANVDTRTGFMVGAYMSFPVSNSPVAIQPEVLYTQKGIEAGESTYQMDYIEIPVLARFDFITDGSITPNVYFGPYLGFNINAEVDGEANILGGPNFEDNVKDTDFGVVVGGGLDFGRFDLGVRYGAGLTEAFENSGSAKNGVLSVTAGIGF